jgi:hypothetical protein
MEQIIQDFDEWLANQIKQEVEYYAIYDNDGFVQSIYPSHAATELSNKIKIPEEVATAILDGAETMLSYRVDIPTKTLIKLSKFSTHSLIKIDDVLHRIIDKQWSNIKDPDISILYDKNNSTLSFSMNEKYKRLIWEGDTEMIFLITDYNDPNVLLNMISLRAGDIAENIKTYKITLPEKFSVYTRRIFEKYVMENK